MLQRYPEVLNRLDGESPAGGNNILLFSLHIHEDKNGEEKEPHEDFDHGHSPWRE